HRASRARNAGDGSHDPRAHEPEQRLVGGSCGWRICRRPPGLHPASDKADSGGRHQRNCEAAEYEQGDRDRVCGVRSKRVCEPVEHAAGAARVATATAATTATAAGPWNRGVIVDMAVVLSDGVRKCAIE